MNIKRDKKMNKWIPLNETVSETISRIGLVYEMALPLKKFKQYVIGLRKQIVENWCLCKYCQIFDKDNRNFSHWRDELYAAIDAINDIKLKNGMSKESALTEVLIDAYEYDSFETVKGVIKRKFSVENLNSNEILDSVSNEFSSKIIGLIKGEKN